MSKTASQAAQANKLDISTTMPALTYQGSKYTDEQRKQAAIMFMTVGNVFKTSQLCKIPARTLDDWVKTEWWAELLTILREQKKDEFNAGFTRIIEKSMQTIEKQLENEEVKARDAATIMGITFDKRQILNLQATSIVGKVIDISKLQGDFERYLAAKEIVSPVDTTTPTD